MITYAERSERLAMALRESAGAPVGLAKETSNLFRDRAAAGKRLLDVRAFDHVLAVNREAGWVEAEGMASYEAIVDETLAHGIMPAVVPQLATITLGGAAAGVGIEATSFRHGLVHETLLEFDVLTGAGEIVTCRPDNEHADLFFGFPNSYGTLGYALRLKAVTLPVQPYVALVHRAFGDASSYFTALGDVCTDDVDFVDGVVFGADALYITEGRFVASAPATSDYRYEHIYYRSIREKTRDFLTARDFLWRWDTDWFWCSRNVGAQNPLVRHLLGRKRLNSRTYQRIMRWNARAGVTRVRDALRGGHHEAVIQDVDIPLENAGAFLEFLHAEIRILPIWICPIRPTHAASRFTFYPMEAGRIYVNFGFWDTVHRRERFEPGHFNRRVEDEVRRLGGIKSLYSESFYDRETFWTLYDRAAYSRLKARYDRGGRFPDLYAKVVLRH